MAIFLKNSAGKILMTSTGKCLTAPSNTSVCTITFAGDYVSWTSATKEALLGDSLSVSGNVVTCKRNTVELWRNTAKIYADTAQYDYGGSLRILAPTEVANDIVITADGATRTLKTYAVNIVTPTGALDAYTSVSPLATSGNASGYKYSYGESVYGFIKVDSTFSNLYNLSASGLTSPMHSSGGYYWYRIGAVSVDEEETIAVDLVLNSFTATFTSEYATWDTDSELVYTGDTLIANGNTVSCIDSNNETRWTATATKFANTDCYSYSGTPSAFINNIGTQVLENVTGNVTIGNVGVTRTEIAGTISFSGTGVNWSTASFTPPTGNMAMVQLTQGSNEVQVFTSNPTTGTMSTLGTSLATAKSGYSLKANSIVAINGLGDSIDNLTGGSLNVVGNVTVTAIATATTATKISQAPIVSLTHSGSVVAASIKNNNAYSVTANITWYDNLNDEEISSSALFVSANSSDTATLSNPTTSEVYAKVYFTKSNYENSNTTTTLVASGPAISTNPILAIGTTSNNAQLIINNSNDYGVTASVAWYDASNSSTIIIAADYQIAANSSTTLTGPALTTTGIYAKVHFWKSGYASSAIIKSDTVTLPALSAPTLAGITTQANDNSDTYYSQTYTGFITIENPNNVACTVKCTLSGSSAVTSNGSWTVAANSTSSCGFGTNGTTTYSIYLTATGYANSPTITGTINPSGGSSGGES